MIDDYTCAGLELPWKNNQREISRIKPGTYRATYQVSPTFGPSIRLHDVPGRSNIVIHVGNYIASLNPRTGRSDSLGCPLPGTHFKDIDGDGHLDVVASRVAMDAIIRRFGTGEGKVIVSDKFLKTVEDRDYKEIARVEGFTIRNKAA